MPREQGRGLAERELRSYRAEDEPTVLALWARALPRWPVSAEAFRSRAIGAEQLVMVADGGLAGYISVARAQARRNLGGGVKLWFAGSGAGRYFWPDVPEDAPDGWAFLRAHGFEPAGEMADLLADIARFRPPERVLGRPGGGVRFELAAEGDAAEVIALQERHFPSWKTFYEDQLALPGTVLVGRADGRIVGTCTVGGPAEYDFLWRALIRGCRPSPHPPPEITPTSTRWQCSRRVSDMLARTSGPGFAGRPSSPRRCRLRRARRASPHRQPRALTATQAACGPYRCLAWWAQLSANQRPLACKTQFSRRRTSLESRTHLTIPQH